MLKSRVSCGFIHLLLVRFAPSFITRRGCARDAPRRPSSSGAAPCPCPSATPDARAPPRRPELLRRSSTLSPSRRWCPPVCSEGGGARSSARPARNQILCSHDYRLLSAVTHLHRPAAIQRRSRQILSRAAQQPIRAAHRSPRYELAIPLRLRPHRLPRLLRRRRPGAGPRSPPAAELGREAALLLLAP
jgi:hypothetical protein